MAFCFLLGAKGPMRKAKVGAGHQNNLLVKENEMLLMMETAQKGYGKDENGWIKGHYLA